LLAESSESAGREGDRYTFGSKTSGKKRRKVKFFWVQATMGPYVARLGEKERQREKERERTNGEEKVHN